MRPSTNSTLPALFFTELVFRPSPWSEAELSAGGLEPVQLLASQHHRMAPVVVDLGTLALGTQVAGPGRGAGCELCRTSCQGAKVQPHPSARLVSLPVLRPMGHFDSLLPSSISCFLPFLLSHFHSCPFLGLPVVFMALCHVYLPGHSPSTCCMQGTDPNTEDRVETR